MHNHCALAPFNYTRKHREGRRHAAIAIREHVDIGALSPVDVQRSVNRSLDVVTVEV